MKITSVTGIYFSAVGNTKKTVEWITDRIAKKLGVTQKPSIDFTLPGSRHAEYVFLEQELVVFGVPVYAGRIPNKILPFVQTLFHGNDALAVPVVTFGNRSYDNALTELCAELEVNGFHTVAGAAVVAEHVMSDKIAPGRPDRRDKGEILDFADRSAQKIQRMDAVCKPVCVKGEYPVGPYYTPLDENGNPAKFLKAKPVTDVKKCNHCLECADVCPMGSIGPDDITVVSGICIKCQACVQKCRKGAKYFDDEALRSHIRMLETNYSRRAESEFFL